MKLYLDKHIQPNVFLFVFVFLSKPELRWLPQPSEKKLN